MTTPNTVSWQSAFWALVPLALNSMIQPSGMVLGLPSKFGFFLRGSPFVCAFDAIFLLLQFLGSLLRNPKHPRRAFESVTKYRFRDATGDKEEGNVASFHENSLFRIAVFFLGALPQVIKLFAIKGVPWTQALGGMYLGSFLVTERIVVISRHRPLLPNHRPIPTDSSNQKFDENIHVARSSSAPKSTLTSTDEAPICIPGFLIGTCFAFSSAVPFHFIMMTCLPSLFGNESFKFRETWLGFVLTFLQYSTALFISMFVRSSEILLANFLFSNTFMMLNIYIAWVHRFSYRDQAIEGRIWTLLALAILFNCIFIVVPADPRKTTRWANASGWIFLIQNIVGSLLYYRFLYDPAGSVKPGWTDQLG